MRCVNNTFASSVFISLILIALGIIYEERAGDLPYVFISIAFVFIISVVFIRIAIGHKLKVTKHMRNDVIGNYYYTLILILILMPVLIIMSWCYGVVLGFINGADPENILRNFFGLLLYGFLPALILAKPRFNHIVIVFWILAVINSLYAMDAILTNSHIYNGNEHIVSITDSRALYSAGFILTIPATAYILGIARSNEKICMLIDFFIANQFRRFITAFSIAGIIIVCSMSKGLILAFASVFLLIFHVRFRRLNAVHKIYVLIFTFILFWSSILLIIMYDSLSIIDTVFNSFTVIDPGNSIRHQQAQFLLDELTFTGNGLGAKLKSGYTRDEVGYGFELSYLNIVHKLGFFAVPLFASYVITIFLVLKELYNATDLTKGTMCLGLMAFLIPGIGNPLLLSPLAVISHLFAIYILFSKFYSIDFTINNKVSKI